MNAFMNGLKTATNYKLTENGGLAHSTTGSYLYDMFSLGGAYRARSDEDCIFLFKKAYEENPTYALKCLFYLRDVRGGTGERRFWRVCMNWLAKEYPDDVRHLVRHTPYFGRWDDLFTFIDTPLEKVAYQCIKNQLALDVRSKTPSLLAKWMPSENTSSAETRARANKLRTYLGMTHKQYRKTLSILRERIRVLERYMSANEWDKIEFDKIPSRAGMIYRNAFARHDVERAKAGAKTYEEFAKDKSTKVNAGVLYPYECVSKAHDLVGGGWSYWDKKSSVPLDDTERLMINKYWDNLPDYLGGKDCSMMCVVDTSGSMTGCNADAPINVAISLGMYCAERISGPFAGQYISFASRPQLIPVAGVDFCDKVKRIYDTNLCDNTNLEAVFELLLNTAVNTHCPQKDIPATIVIISDMEIDCATGWYSSNSKDRIRTMMEKMRDKWAQYGYTMPKLVYWNVQSRHDTFLDDGPDTTYVSGMSPIIFKQVLTGKTGKDLMFEILDSERYSGIY